MPLPETCDCCCQNARVEWLNDTGRVRLAMCWHHSREHGPRLMAEGLSARTVITPVTADPASH